MDYKGCKSSTDFLQQTIPKENQNDDKLGQHVNSICIEYIKVNVRKVLLDDDGESKLHHSSQNTDSTRQPIEKFEKIPKNYARF